MKRVCLSSSATWEQCWEVGFEGRVERLNW